MVSREGVFCPTFNQKFILSKIGLRQKEQLKGVIFAPRHFDHRSRKGGMTVFDHEVY